MTAKEIGAGEKLLTQRFKPFFFHNKREVGALFVTGVYTVGFLTPKIQKAVFTDGMGMSIMMVYEAAVGH